MKTKLVITVSILLLCFIGSAQVPDSLKFKSLGPAEFQKALQSDSNALLIDVREFFEYKKKRIDHAVNIPSSGSIEIAADTIGKGSSLFLYCTTGYRSKREARNYYDKGFSKIYSLDGGINAWKKEGLPVNRKRIKKSKVETR